LPQGLGMQIRLQAAPDQLGWSGWWRTARSWGEVSFVVSIDVGEDRRDPGRGLGLLEVDGRQGSLSHRSLVPSAVGDDIAIALGISRGRPGGVKALGRRTIRHPIRPIPL